ncbi:alanine racemase [Falsibacillus albus]|uniref:Alanine racemase n=1 Tax=Falsibacillus albus TaxID=2478915 RepID=A0A3L7JS76_9BACI|nr:alanine racemase [Falsibacillus albus]RLQ93174.1 alanine racemase [Falsibacillus albus]
MDTHTQFFRDTWVEVNLDDVMENVKSVRRLLPENISIFAVVKANAYGHGDAQVAEAAMDAGAHGLAVAFLDEALSLRKNGIESPILVLGASRPQDVRMAVDHNISLTVFQESWIEEAGRFLKGHDILKVHIKCDTGMGRIGVSTLPELKEVEQSLVKRPNFEIEGVFTHFATADELDESYYHRQLKIFEEMVGSLSSKPKYIHSANSAASLRQPQKGFNAVRLGIAMYGLSPSEEMKGLLPFPLKEAFSLHSRLVHVKKINPGDSVSYGATYTAEKEEWIGTIPIGYADGWIRKLQSQEVLVEGKRAPIVGRICMDQCMVRLPHEVKAGTKVTLIGKQGEERIGIDELAKKLDTINYEIPCMISNRVPRIFVLNNKPIEVSNRVLSSKK